MDPAVTSRACFAGRWLCVLIWLLAISATASGQPIAGDSFAGDKRTSETQFGWTPASRGWKTSARPTWRFVDDGLRYSLGNRTLGAGGAVEIRGRDDRDNPLRRRLASPITADELFVRFVLRYDAASIDTASEDEGEFFVLWLDDIDGSDGATHNTNVPNIGLHVPTRGPDKGQNRFMVRIGASNSAFTKVNVEGDRTFLVVGRLSKSIGGTRSQYDTFQMWVNPDPDGRSQPLATSTSRRGINLVEWVGFATGRKTEPDDRIYVDEVALGLTWESVLGLPAKKGAQPEVPQQYADVDFRRDVYPILSAHCFECHRGRDAESGSRLDVLEEVLGHTTGHAMAMPGRSEQSPIVQRVTATANSVERMPPEGERLSDREIAVLRAWIAQGVSWDEKLLPSPSLESSHWAFQPIRRPAVPRVADGAWAANPLDAFLAAGRTGQNLPRSPAASPLTLIRRLTLDLTGLPPELGDIQHFVSDESPGAYRRLVDRLLASPHYGERWGRHWLDVARWAESNGYQHNRLRHHAWRYRDYVIRSFNQDKPYDAFVRQQVAGDELEPYSDENLVATGFLAAARVSANQMNRDIQRNDILVDIVNAAGESLLGLTMGCAQCHNHKFDPISARDYYRFQAFFAKGQLGNLVLKHPAQQGKPSADRPQAFGFYAPSTSRTPVTRLPMRDIKYPLPYNPAELARTKTYLLIRGEVDRLGPVVDPGWPLIFGRSDDPQKLNRSPRTALADWLASPDNPLTARVWVNRIWHYHFGRGLVETTSDFGVRTEAPVQQDLLDWLAAELIDSGWSTKHIHRLIVLSNTYRQASRFRAECAEIDPDNQFYWRWTPRRLEAEAIRDSILAVSGELDLARGGPGIAPDSPESDRRRTVYLRQKRQEMPVLQELFDGAGAVESCSRRRTSTVPLQPLYLLNSEFVVERAGAFARRVARAGGADVQARVNIAFALALGRQPDEDELVRALDFLQGVGNDTGQAASAERWLHFCHALLNLNEFAYVH